MKSYSSRELIQIITTDGWYHIKTVGDHWQFKHHIKPGKVTITHPAKDVPGRTVMSILKQAGIRLE